jgi:3-methyladenine DNA glycosylase/8-oxoguanine DNA glycosylase
VTFKLEIKLPTKFSFRHTVGSHGWYDLPPFEHESGSNSLGYTFAGFDRDPAISVNIKKIRGTLSVEASAKPGDVTRIERGVRHILRLDDELDEFYKLLTSDGRLGWVAEANAGRLLRSPTVWEDLVKTICTTNCSWALTRKMVANLVDKLGDEAADGRKAFPTVEAMAAQPVEFYREEIRAGYRSAFFVELAARAALGDIELERWANSDLATPDLKKELKKVKGVGDYAAENLLKLLGRFDGLALDSWLRAQFYKIHNNGRACNDKKIEKFYGKFGDWKGLAIWCDMTQKWFE